MGVWGARQRSSAAWRYCPFFLSSAAILERARISLLPETLVGFHRHYSQDCSPIAARDAVRSSQESGPDSHAVDLWGSVGDGGQGSRSEWRPSAEGEGFIGQHPSQKSHQAKRSKTRPTPKLESCVDLEVSSMCSGPGGWKSSASPEILPSAIEKAKADLQEFNNYEPERNHIQLSSTDRKHSETTELCTVSSSVTDTASTTGSAPCTYTAIHTWLGRSILFLRTDPSGSERVQMARCWSGDWTWCWWAQSRSSTNRSRCPRRRSSVR